MFRESISTNLALLAGVSLGVAPALATAGGISGTIGAFDVSDSADLMVQVEYFPDLEWSGFKPRLGLFFTDESSGYLYAGVGYPFQLAQRWALAPSVSVGYYHEGAGKDLGHDVEFYSQLQLNYELSKDAFLGVGIGHISNAGLGDDNPGANTAYLSYGHNF